MAHFIEVIGAIWLPAVTAATRYSVSEHDLATMRYEDGTINRDDIEGWLLTHSGDFRCIDDFSAWIDGTEYPWAHEESAVTFDDCFYELEE